jgi:hypothetical protein
MEVFLMSEQMPNDATASSSDVASADVLSFKRPDIANTKPRCVEGQEDTAEKTPLSIDHVSTCVVLPIFLFTLPSMNKDGPCSPRTMGDSNIASRKLQNYGPGAWLLSPMTGFLWAKWPNGDVGWVPASVTLPEFLRVQLSDGEW